MKASCPLPAGELGLERVEPLCPERPEVIKPPVDFPERPRVDGIEPTRALGPNRREPALAKDPEVL